jgi:molecular chaperone IbpA
MMDKLATTNIPSYPPYNIIRIAPDQYQIVIAAAGFSKDDITINKIKNELHVKSQSNEERADQKDIVYIHKGLATRDFTLKFNLADDVEVVEANFENGLLKIELQHTLPEEEKPKRIPIF